MQVMGRLNKTALYFDTATFLTGKCQLVVENSNNVIIDTRARGGEGGCCPPPPKFWATQIFWAARENLGKASF